MKKKKCQIEPDNSKVTIYSIYIQKQKFGVGDFIFKYLFNESLFYSPRHLFYRKKKKD